MQTCYQNTRKQYFPNPRCCFAHVLITCLHWMLAEHKVCLFKFRMWFSLKSDNMFVWSNIRTKGKQYVLNSTCCVPCVLIRFHADMLSEFNENNTFQIQRVRNQCNNNVLYGDVIRTNGKQYLPIPKCQKPMK